MPVRIQRVRTKGWRMPPGAVYVGRPTIWANPFRVGALDPIIPYHPPMSAARCVDLYRLGIVAARAAWFRDSSDEGIFSAKCASLYHAWEVRAPHLRCCEIEASLEDISGRDLCCWCALISNGIYRPCHADVLLCLANDMTMAEVIHENTLRAQRTESG